MLECFAYCCKRHQYDPVPATADENMQQVQPVPSSLATDRLLSVVVATTPSSPLSEGSLRSLNFVAGEKMHVIDTYSDGYFIAFKHDDLKRQVGLVKREKVRVDGDWIKQRLQS